MFLLNIHKAGDCYGRIQCATKKALHKAEISKVKAEWVSWVGAWLWDLGSNDGSGKYVNTIPPRPQPITVANKEMGG